MIENPTQPENTEGEDWQNEDAPEKASFEESKDLATEQDDLK